MPTFTISVDNNITVFASAEEAAQAGDSTATTFDSQATLAKLSLDWPLSRFVDIWNSIPGNTEVSKFADRKKAVTRIWRAIQPLAGNGQASEPEQPEAAKAAKTSKAAKPAKGANAAKKGKQSKKAAAGKKATEKGERSNKKAEVIAMMKRAKGATLAEIMEATGWQKHTVRGFVSILGSKGGEKIESSKNAAGERTYKIGK